MNKKVFVAISGGVDSSAALYLLKKKGFDCTGVYFYLYKQKDHKQQEKSAFKVCKALNVPFKTYNLTRTFQKEVVDYFIDEYKKGRTPNPCIVCNRKIKFENFLKRACEDGADFVATGHYAKVILEDNEYKLLKPKDKRKDQTYFLYRLNQKALSRLKFPLAAFKKHEVRQIAKTQKLPTFDADESQDICFLKEKDIRSFLKQAIKAGKGKIKNTQGKVLGSHDGYYNFTIGQRGGLGIGGGVAYFVVDIKPETNEIIVAKGKSNNNLYHRKILLERVHWISESIPDFPLKIEASIRYSHNPQRSRLEKANGQYTLFFENFQRAVTPGQSAVFYDGEVCLGGGVIGKSEEGK